MGDAQLPRDITWSHSLMSQVHDARPHDVGQGSAVHEHSSQLVHAAVTCNTDQRLAVAHRRERGEREREREKGAAGESSTAKELRNRESLAD